MTQITERERRLRLAIEMCGVCAQLAVKPYPGSPESQAQADAAARQLGHHHHFPALDLFPR